MSSEGSPPVTRSVRTSSRATGRDSSSVYTTRHDTVSSDVRFFGMPCKPTGYWLFVLDCERQIESECDVQVNRRTLQYIASNIWTQLPALTQNNYKDEAKDMRRRHQRAVAPGFLRIEELTEMCDKYDVFRILYDNPEYKNKLHEFDTAIGESKKQIEECKKRMEERQQNCMDDYEKKENISNVTKETC